MSRRSTARKTTDPSKQPQKTKFASVVEAERAFGLVLEDIRSQMKVVVESVTASTATLRSDMTALEARLDQRITVLEQVVRELVIEVRKNSEDIRKNSEAIRKNSDDIRAVRQEVARLRHDFDHREERGRVGALEIRVAAIEAHLGISSR